MDKQGFLRENKVHQMPKLVQVMAGRLYDAAFEAGRREGYRQGVDAYITKEAEVHKRIYDQGRRTRTTGDQRRLRLRPAR